MAVHPNQMKIHHRIAECFKMLGVRFPQIVWTDIQYDVNCDFKSKNTNGRCDWNINRDMESMHFTFNFNKLIWQDDTAIEKYCRETVAHEIAHMAVRVLHGSHPSTHGKEWQSIMRLFGLEANRCNDYKTEAFMKYSTKGKVECKCGCQTHYMTKRAVSNLNRYACRKCMQKLQVV